MTPQAANLIRRLGGDPAADTRLGDALDAMDAVSVQRLWELATAPRFVVLETVAHEVDRRFRGHFTHRRAAELTANNLSNGCPPDQRFEVWSAVEGDSLDPDSPGVSTLLTVCESHSTRSTDGRLALLDPTS